MLYLITLKQYGYDPRILLFKTKEQYEKACTVLTKCIEEGEVDDEYLYNQFIKNKIDYIEYESCEYYI